MLTHTSNPLRLISLAAALTGAAGALAQPVYVRPQSWFNPDGQVSSPFSNLRAGICGSFQAPIDMRLAPGTYHETISISAPGNYTAPNGEATIDPTSTASTTFRMVSYNVRLWPGFFVGQTIADQERADLIGPRLSAENADVVVMQESWDYKLDAFDASSRNNALRGIYFFQYYGSAFFSGDNMNSGLLTQSVHVLSGGTQFRYSECDGNDCQASKGWTRVLLNKGGFNIAVFNTHTQAGNGSDNFTTRQSQIAELANDIIFFRALNPSYAVFVGGDFNCDRLSSEFANMVTSFGALAGLSHGALNEQCSPQTSSCTVCTYNTMKQIFGNDGVSAILDHILYADSLDGTVKVLPTDYRVLQYRRTDGGVWCRDVIPTGCTNDLSDHEPIRMDFVLKRVTP